MRDRSTVELVLMLLGGTVCLILLVACVAVAVVVLAHPERAVNDTADGLMTSVEAILFTVLGIVAGRYGIPSTRKADVSQKEEGQP